MTGSIIYRHRSLYTALMRLLYRGEGFRSRYETIAALIPAGASVVEACCGDCRLAEEYLLPKGVRYIGLDISKPFKDVRDAWLEHLEREYIAALMSAHGRNVSAVARAAGLDRTYVHRLIRKHGL